MSALTTPTEVSMAPPRALAPPMRVRLIVQVVALTALFSAAAVYEAMHVFAIYAPEVWIHLRSGEWILHHRSIPHAGVFSQWANLPWNDSTWGFDVILAAVYKAFGLRGIPILLMVLKVALAGVTFLLARAGRMSFWNAVVLSGVAQYVISGLQPLPYVCSILFFTVELWLLMRGRSGDVRFLSWLPILFVVWANLHVQFVAGLVLLALFLIALWGEYGLGNLGVGWIDARVLPVSLRPATVIGALSWLATFLTPYTFHLLPRGFSVLYSPAAFEHFSEMSSMSFRRPQEFVLMLLVMAGFLALGRRRSLALFESLILIAGTLVAFRIQRDAWLAVLPAVAVLSNGFLLKREGNEAPRTVAWRRQLSATAALTAMVFVIAALSLSRPETMMEKVSENFPVKACNYIRENRLPQPLFNAYIWGSFLTWYLPEYPVVADSRIELYGNEQLATYFDVVGGTKRLEEEPMVARAGVLLLERESAMAKALTNLPALSAQYRLVYSDDIAAVFVPQSRDQ